MGELEWRISLNFQRMYFILKDIYIPCLSLTVVLISMHGLLFLKQLSTKTFLGSNLLFFLLRHGLHSKERKMNIYEILNVYLFTF